MAHIFKSKSNGKLYLLDHLVLDTRFLNRNAFAGIYPLPYGHSEKLPNHMERQSPSTPWVEQNFDKVCELW